MSILLYYSNWWEIAHPGSLGSLGPAWSLSVEEQFYVVWPWVVVGVSVLARRRTRISLIAITSLGVVSIGVVRRQVWLANVRPGTSGDDIVNASLSFFRNSFQRGDGLIFGCLLAVLLHGLIVTPRLRRCIATAAVPALIIAGIIVGSTHYNTWQPWVPFIPVWGLSLFDLSVTVVIAWLVVSPSSPVARVLSLRPFTWVGRRAYGVYLLSPLVLDVVLRRTGLTRWAMDGTVIAASLVVAGLSFRYFETPFLRFKERFSSRSTRETAVPVG